MRQSAKPTATTEPGSWQDTSGTVHPRRTQNFNDIVIPQHGYAARWNLAADGKTWNISATGVEEVGCIHTCQGLELDTISVIIGPDLLFRDCQLVVDATARARSENSLSGWKAGMATNAEATQERVSRLIRNTYRTLMSRGIKNCLVFACDPELQEYLRDQSGDGMQ